MNEEQRLKKNARSRALRKEKQKKLELNEELLKQGKRICSRCFKKKELSEYGINKKKVKKEINKVCDACLIKMYATKSYSPEALTPEFWRKKAYCANTTAVTRFKKLKDGTTIQNLDNKIQGVDLVKKFNEQNGLCPYCHKDLSSGIFQLDHCVPLSKGGEHSIGNLDIICVECNRIKHNHDVSDFKKLVYDYAKRIIQVAELEDKEPLG